MYIESLKNIDNAVRNTGCIIFCEENSSFLINAGLSTSFLWIAREAAAAVNSNA